MNIDMKNKTTWFASSLFFAITGLFTLAVIFSPSLVDASSDVSSLNFYNERVQPVYPNAVLFSWDTDKPSTSKVIYGETLNSETESNTDNYKYTYSTEKVGILVAKHSMLITGLSQDVSYSFYPVSMSGDGSKGIGNEKTIILTNPCTYLKSYLKIGENNDAGEVTKLQTFLRDFEGFSKLEVTGVFDQATFDAVSAFQIKYKEDILTPWGVDVPTGYVYYTTQKKINELYCNEKFSFDQNQITEINNFRVSLNKLQDFEIQDTEDNIDLKTIGQITIPAREIKDVELVTIDGNQNKQIIPTPEGVIGTTTQVAASDGMVASIFNSAKSMVNVILDSVKNFFKKDNSQKENLDLEEGGDSVVPEDV